MSYETLGLLKAVRPGDYGKEEIEIGDKHKLKLTFLSPSNDPMADVIRALIEEIELLKERVKALGVCR